jgi:hypothetical protein
MLSFKSIDSHNGYKCCTRYLFIATDESTGLKIENARDNINIAFFFNLYAQRQNYVHTSCIFRSQTKESLITAHNVRMVVYNEKTREVYYNNLFDEPKNVKKTTIQKNRHNK